MTKNKIVATSIAALAIFALATFLYKGDTKLPEAVGNTAESQLVRPYSFVYGPKNAPVTIVEFFDPACEACRAFHPIVKQIRAKFPQSVKVVLRYTTFHKGSDEVVRILESARLQSIFKLVLENILEKQPSWASHHAPDISKAWQAAAEAGLDVKQARKDIMNPEITAVLNQDMADVKALGVKQTPTFFVNGKPLPSFGAQQLYDLVRQEVEITRKNSLF
jgi:protein-disulfide isomerase